MPPWQAPIVGSVVLIIIGLRVAYGASRPITVGWVAGWAAAGLAIGMLVALSDGPGPGTLISRFMALISPATALLPIFGLPFNVAAYLANRRHPGAYRTIAKVTLIGSLMLSLVAVWLWLNEK